MPRYPQQSLAEMSFSTEALLRAMAPIDMVIERFIEETAASAWGSEEGQHDFALTLSRVLSSAFPPTKRYIRRILTRFASKLEREQNVEIEDEVLAELIALNAFGPSSLPGVGGKSLGGGDAPDPLASGYCSYRIPTTEPKSDDIIGIRIFPHHNDVGIRRLWEAGAVLAEYLISYPEEIRGRSCLELGAGVGLTGIVVAGMCGTNRLHMTDYTDACLENMKHNIEMNADWLARKGVDVNGNEISSGYLDWNDCAQDEEGKISFHFADAEVLLAADVCYDQLEIPALIRTVKRLLQHNKHGESTKKKAIFATTYRNHKTFDLFEQELKKEGISCKYTDREVLCKLPEIFPCYFQQPRTDVRICTMTA